MDKKILIGGILIALIIFCVALYFSYTNQLSTVLIQTQEENNNNPVPTQAKTTSTVVKTVSQSQSQPTSPSSSNTFKSIFDQQGNHACTYEQITKSTKTDANIYIADGKMRAEFRSLTSDKITSNIMVYNGGILYVWVEGMGVGTKSVLNSVSDLPFVLPSNLSGGSVLVSGTNSVSWDCHAWSKNNSMLVPPSNVKFD